MRSRPPDLGDFIDRGDRGRRLRDREPQPPVGSLRVVVRSVGAKDPIEMPSTVDQACSQGSPSGGSSPPFQARPATTGTDAAPLSQLRVTPVGQPRGWSSAQNDEEARRSRKAPASMASRTAGSTHPSPSATDLVGDHFSVNMVAAAETFASKTLKRKIKRREKTVPWRLEAAPRRAGGPRTRRARPQCEPRAVVLETAAQDPGYAGAPVVAISSRWCARTASAAAFVRGPNPPLRPGRWRRICSNSERVNSQPVVIGSTA